MKSIMGESMHFCLTPVGTSDVSERPCTVWIMGCSVICIKLQITCTEQSNYIISHKLFL